MKLSAAQHLAARIVTELQPYCSRIEVAGSIRRQCGEVNDIDLVLIPRDPAALRARLLQRCSPIQDGPVNLLVRLPNGFQLDIFMAHPERRDLLETKPSNFGSLFLCRTGSKEHNIKLTTRAQRMGLKWKVYEGIFADSGHGPCLASETEADIFKALEMDYLEPQNRI